MNTTTRGVRIGRRKSYDNKSDKRNIYMSLDYMASLGSLFDLWDLINPLQMEVLGRFQMDTIEWLGFKEHLIGAKGLGWDKGKIISRITTDPLCPFLCIDCPKSPNGYWVSNDRVVGDIPKHVDNVKSKRCNCPWQKGSKYWLNQARWWQKITNPKKIDKYRDKLITYIEETWKE